MGLIKPLIVHGYFKINSRLASGYSHHAYFLTGYFSCLASGSALRQEQDSCALAAGISGQPYFVPCTDLENKR
jgi:hypothetical protein